MFKLLGVTAGLVVAILVSVDDGREEGFRHARSLYLECSSFHEGTAAIDFCVQTMSRQDRLTTIRKWESYDAR